MKFLVIAQQKENGPTASTDEREKMLQRIEQRVKAGKMEVYYMPGWNKNVSIEEHESMVEALEAIKNPSKYNNFEIYPLMDWKEARDILYK